MNLSVNASVILVKQATLGMDPSLAWAKLGLTSIIAIIFIPGKLIQECLMYQDIKLNHNITILACYDSHEIM